MDGKKSRLIFCLFIFIFLLSQSAGAAIVEISGMVGLSKSEYDDGYNSSTRRYTSSIDFKFTPVSSIQFEYTDSYQTASYNTNIGVLVPVYTKVEVEDKAKIYSFNWVQNLVPSKWLIQPYILFGGGRMDRSYRQSYPNYPNSGFEFKQRVNSGTAGAGLRIFLTKSMAVKSEVKTYVPDFRFSKWKENQLLSIGISWLF